MNAPVNLKMTEALTAQEKVEHLSNALNRAEQILETNRAVRRFGFWVGGAGLIAGLLGLASASVIHLTFKHPEPVFVERNPVTGELTQAARAIDAPLKFSEGTIKQHLGGYLDNCETYRWQSVSETTRRCQLFLAPTERAKFAAQYDAYNPEGPIQQLGRDGTISVADGVTMEEIATGRDGVKIWGMRFTKVIAARGKAVVCQPWTVRVTFQWRPDLAMSEENRRVNLGGMQILDRSTGPDLVRRQGC